MELLLGFGRNVVAAVVVGYTVVALLSDLVPTPCPAATLLVLGWFNRSGTGAGGKLICAILLLCLLSEHVETNANGVISVKNVHVEKKGANCHCIETDVIS